MLGPTLDYPTKRIFRAGMAQGESLGIKKVIESALRKGNTAEEVASFIGIPLEDVLEVQKNMMQEA